MNQGREERSLLDLIRWVSAVIVAAGHGWAAVAPVGGGLANRLLWALADTRHSWVVVFFVLSGYLVGGKALLRADRFDLPAYAIARFSRIYIVLLPALALTAGLDGLAHHLAPGSPIYAGIWRDGLFGPTPPFQRYSAGEVAASLLSLESLVAQPIGSDGPLWSLGFEWTFYFALPALMLPADALGSRWGGRVWAARGAALALTLAVLVALHALYAALLWLIWLAGALAHICVERGRWPQALRWGGLAVAVAGLGLGLKLDYHYADALIGFGLAAFLARFPPGERGWRPGLDRALASGSYSLYVTHLPVMAFLCMGFIRAGLLTGQGAASPPALALMLALLATSTALVAILFQRMFERRTEPLRRLLRAASARLPSRPRPGGDPAPSRGRA